MRCLPIRCLGRRDLVVATGRAYIPVLPGRRGRMARMISLVTAWLVVRRWREDDVAPMGAINADRR